MSVLTIHRSEVSEVLEVSGKPEEVLKFIGYWGMTYGKKGEIASTDGDSGPDFVAVLRRSK